jgi:Outer membrane protein beta-barrel domain
MENKLSFKFLAVSLFSFIFFLGAEVLAQSHSSSYSGSGFSGRRNYISGAFGLLAPGQNMLTGTTNNGNTVNTTGFTLSGLFGIGADYDYMENGNFSFGGTLRYYNVSTTINGQAWQNTLFTIGPTVRGYIPIDKWQPTVGVGLMYLAPGLTQSNTAYTVSSGVGLMLSLGVLYQLNETVALGIETMRLTCLSNNMNGNLIEDYMFKGRFAIGQ